MGDPKGKGSEKTADQLPDRVSLLHKGGFPQYATAGAVTPSWNTFLRPSGNSPSQQHLTQGLLLCSRITIQHKEEKVNTFCQRQGEIVIRLSCKTEKILNNFSSSGKQYLCKPILEV